jgi:hypothetical protein
VIALMTEAAGTLETSLNFYRIARRYNPEDSHPHKASVVFLFWGLAQTLKMETVPPEFWHLPTRPHGANTQTVMKTSNVPRSLTPCFNVHNKLQQTRAYSHR